jgi:TRAP-type mannitol/chloroaromatic compound transport system permease large subunit
MAILKFFGVMESGILIPVPLFVFVGTILEKSGVAERVYQSLHELSSPVRGGLAFAPVVDDIFLPSAQESPPQR